MKNWMMLTGIIPLVLFVIVDTFAGLKAGLITAAIAAFLEAALSLYMFGELDIVTGTSVGLVLILAIVSWKMKSPLLFKLQPVIVGLLISLFLIGSYFYGKPFLLEMTMKYSDFFPPEIRTNLHLPFFQQTFSLATLYCGLTISIQTLLVLWAALKLNNWWWIIFRGVGFYLFLSIGFFLAQYQAARLY